MHKLDAPIFGLAILTPAVADGDSRATATLSAKMRNATAHHLLSAHWSAFDHTYIEAI
jgi:hypothetical protein